MVMFLDKPRFDPASKAVGGEEATAGEIWDTTRESMRVVDNANSRLKALEEAYDARIGAVKQATGVALNNPVSSGAGGPSSMAGFGVQEETDPHAEFQRRLEELAAEKPELRDVIKPDRPVLEDAKAKAQGAEKAFEDTWSRSSGGLAAWAARLGGGFYGALHDPVNIFTLPLGPTGKAGTGAKGLLWMGLKQGAANAGTEAMIQPFVQQWRKDSNLDYGLGQAALNIAGSGLFGAAVDVGVRAPVRGVRRAVGRPYLGPDEPGSGARLPDLPEGAPPSAPAPRIYRGPDPLTPLEALEQAARNAPEGSVLRRASEGDEDALRQLAAELGPDADPAIRRALDELEIEKMFTTPLNVDGGEHHAALARAVRGESGAPDLPVGDAIVAPVRRELADIADESAGRALEIEGRKVDFRAVDPRQVTTDAATFQFKSGGDAAGVTDRLRGVTRWDPVSAGKAIVFERADGSMVIADGHQRLGLAKRVAASGQDAKLDAYVFREADGWTPEDVRAYAALKNMRESSGTSVDMAQVMRDRPDLIDGSLPLTDAKLRDAAMLARLSPDAFDAVVAGRLPPSYAALIGESVADSARHRSLLDEMAAADLANTQQARLYLKQLMELPTTTETQMTLFGEESFTRTVLIERAQVLDSALKTLKQDKRIFGLLGREADKIEGAPALGRDPVRAQSLERLMEAAAARLADAETRMKGALIGAKSVEVDVANLRRMHDKAKALRSGFDDRTEFRKAVDKLMFFGDPQDILDLRAERLEHRRDETMRTARQLQQEYDNAAAEADGILQDLESLKTQRDIALGTRAPDTALAAPAGSRNILAREANQIKAERASQLADLIEKLATSRGPVATILNDAAASVARGLDPKLASRAFVDRIADTLERDGLPGLVRTEEAPKAELAPVRMDDPIGPEAKAQMEDINWALELDDEIKFAIRAYHGTPHDFDRFDLGKIGTGEGAQVFGHGLYFAEAEGVARKYQVDVSEQLARSDPIAHRVQRAMETARTDKDALEFLRQRMEDSQGASDKYVYRQAIERFDEIVRKLRGQLYEVEIDVEPERLLDWDKPLGEQPEAARRIAENLDSELVRAWKQNGTWEHLTGADLYRELAGGKMTRGTAADGLHAKASQALREVGVPGIRYLDQGSRSAGGGTRNIVIFDDSLIKITHKNGKAVSAEERKAAVDAMFSLRGGKADQTQTPEFKRWFGDSKVVDESGKPLVMYRGSQHPNAEAYNNKSLIFLTPKRQFAEGYARGGGTVFDLYVKAEKPFDASRGEGYRLWKEFKAENDVYPTGGTERGALPFWTAERDLRAWLDARGVEYDGIYFAENDGSYSLAVVKPEQIKSAIGNRGTFDPNDPRIAFALRGFYSPAIRAAESISMKKGTGEQFLKQITKVPGVRKDELEWMGLEEFLKGKPSVTRDEVLAFMRAHQVELDEKVLGGGQRKYGQVVADDITDDELLAQLAEPTGSEFAGYTKYAGHKVPGGESYRELLIRLPKLEGKYTSKHFQDQEIVHLRVDDRTAPNGEKVLFINEVQSDLHQKGRMSGYDQDVKFTAEEEELRSLNGKDWAGTLTDADRARVAELKSAGVDESLQAKVKSVGTTPNAPFKGDLWLELALKRALLYASENGYDAISWARSDQIAKAVGAEPEKLALQYDQKIGRFLDKYTKKWGAKVEEEAFIPPDKEMLKPGTETADGYVSRTFYDPLKELLPRPFNNQTGARQALDGQLDWEGAIREAGDPANVAKAQAIIDQYKDYYAPWTPPNSILRITPEMRASVMEGQPFSVKGGQTQPTPPRNATLHNTTLSTRAADEMASMRAEIDKAIAKSLPPGWRAEVRQRLVFGDLSERIQKRNPGVPPSLEIEGTFDPYEKIIYASLAALDPVERAYEEAGHAIKAMRLIPQADYAILQAKAAEIGARQKFRIDERYGDVYGARWKDNPARLEEALEEEAIMQMVAARARGDTFGRQANAILDKLIKFLRAIRDMLGVKGFRTFEDVFEDMTEGGFARAMEAQRGQAVRNADVLGGEVMAGGPGKTADAALRVYHSSPSDFTAFSGAHAGTGQGQRMHGPGVYLGSTEDVAKFFGRSIAKQRGELSSAAKGYLDRANGDRDKALEAIADRKKAIKEGYARETLERAEADIKRAPSGYFYEATIKASPENLVQGETRLADQPLGKTLLDLIGDYDPENVNFAAVDRTQDYNPLVDEQYVPILPARAEDLTGTQAVAILRSRGMDNAALTGKGIVGMSYAEGDEAIKGKTSYVIFDPAVIEIASRQDAMFAIREPQSPTAADASFIARAEAASEIMFALGDEGKGKTPEKGGEAKSAPERPTEGKAPAKTAAPSLPGGRESKRIRNLINQAAAEGKLPREDADALIQRFDMLEAFHKDGGKAKQQIARELDAEAEHRKRQKALAEGRRRAIVAMLTGFRDARGQADPAKAMQALIENLGQHELPQGFTDVAGHQRAIYGMALADLDAMLHEFRKTLITGTTRNKAQLANVVRELHGEATGDEMAAAFAQATAKVMEDLRLRFNAAGGNIAKRKDWNMPQSHDKVALLRGGRDAKKNWVEFTLPLLDLKWMKHPLTGDDMPPAEARKMLGDVWENLVSDGWHEREAMMQKRGVSAIANTRADPRSLIFANADAWMKYSARYGSGDDALAIMVSHIRGMTKDIAAMEVLGPNPTAMLEYMRQFVVQQATLRRAGMPAHFPTVREITGLEFKPGSRFRDPLGYANVMTKRAENMWRIYTGAASAPESPGWAETMATIRNINVATKLGGAFVSGLGDPFWQVAARKFAGLPAVKMFPEILNQIKAGGEREARRSGVIAETFLHMHNEGAREGAAWSASKVSGYVADRVLTLSMLNGLTRAGNHAMSMGIQGHLADMAGKAFADLHPRLQRMFRRWGLEATDWDAIRLDAGGRPREVDFLSPADIRRQLVDNGGDPSIAERYLAMTLGEAQYATLTGSITAQARIYGNMQAGTPQRELWSMFMQFKSFAVNLALLQLSRMAHEFVSQGFSRGAQYAVLALGMATLGGALVEQLQQLRNGKDPRAMNTGEFWMAAAYRSGGMSIWGDLLYASENRFGGGVASTIAGPSASTLNDILNLTYGSAKKTILFSEEKEKTNFGRQLSSAISRYTPGSSIWYVRAAWERALMDNLQRMLDPEAEASFRRKIQNIRRDYKQEYWWKPGGGFAPQRGPRLGAALPAR